jgi:hypothetical protein
MQLSELSELSEAERLILEECRPALRRAPGRSKIFRRAPACRPRPALSTGSVWRLEKLGLLQWVNRCRTAAVLTEEGKAARDA